MSDVYTIFRHETQPDGRIVTHVECNDDNDDGFPDPVLSIYTLGPQPKHLALRPPMDRTHRGFIGHKVAVFLDGEELR